MKTGCCTYGQERPHVNLKTPKNKIQKGAIFDKTLIKCCWLVVVAYEIIILLFARISFIGADIAPNHLKLVRIC